MNFAEEKFLSAEHFQYKKVLMTEAIIGDVV